MKPSIALTIALAVAATPAFAGKSQPQPKKIEAVEKSAKKPNCGESYDLAARHAQTPTGDAKEVKKVVLSQGQFSEVVKAKLGDVEYCWDRLPELQRKADTTAVLKLEIDPSGEVETVGVDGKIPEETQRCIAVAAAKWEFPMADELAQFEYAVALRAM